MLRASPLPAKIDAAEARLAYVAVTRARHRLDLGGLSWINRHPEGNPNRIPARSLPPLLT
jgi:ATP-dependent exoDNAse (exonuclease V) beta subunit